MFAEEKPHLQTLPLARRSATYQYGERTVPPRMAVLRLRLLIMVRRRAGSGARSTCNGTSMYVRLIDPRTGQLLREHLGQKRGGHRIRDEDRPKRTPQHTHQLLARAHKVRAPTSAPSATRSTIARPRPASAAPMGMLSLAGQYGSAVW